MPDPARRRARQRWLSSIRAVVGRIRAQHRRKCDAASMVKERMDARTRRRDGGDAGPETAAEQQRRRVRARWHLAEEKVVSLLRGGLGPQRARGAPAAHALSRPPHPRPAELAMLSAYERPRSDAESTDEWNEASAATYRYVRAEGADAAYPWASSSLRPNESRSLMSNLSPEPAANHLPVPQPLPRASVSGSSLPA